MIGRGRRRLAGAGFVVGLLTTLPACGSPTTPTAATTSTSTTPTSTTPTSVAIQQGTSAEEAACEADARTVDTALQAYMAEHGAYPSPPAPWSAASYASDYQPLTSGGGGGPFLPGAPGTRFYVIEYDAAGHLWVAPPGSYQAAYNRGQDFDANPGVCLAAVG